jgi:hypothetical protein
LEAALPERRLETKGRELPLEEPRNSLLNTCSNWIYFIGLDFECYKKGKILPHSDSNGILMFMYTTFVYLGRIPNTGDIGI